MNFGDYLRNLLSEKQVSIAELAKKLNIKSKNEIYRLFQNKHSYEKTSELMEKILSVVQVSQGERNELYNLMNGCKIGYSERKANRILSKLYAKERSGESPKFMPFVNFIKENSQKDITVYVGMIQENQCVILSRLLDEYPSLKVIHTVDFNTTDEKIASQLFAVITFFQNNNHRLFEKSGQSDNAVLAVVKDESICKMAVFDNNTFCESNISAEMADYINEKKLEACGDELKQNRVKMGDYEQMLEYTCACDLNETYVIHGMICLAEIPFKILYRLFEDANYFGFPLEHPFIQSILEVEKKHDEFRNNSDVTHFYLMSENYLKKFLQTGVTSGYINEFRPLNLDERIETLKMFEYSGHGVRYNCRFFKEGYDVIDTECCSIDNVGVYITDSQSTPKKTYMQAVITHPKAMRVFRSFSKWFWDSCMYSDEESRDMLDKYVEELKKSE